MTTTLELQFGLPPSDPQSEKRHHAADFCAALEQLGVTLRPVFATDYRSLVEDLVGGKCAIAWLGPISLLRAERQARPLLSLQRAGKASYHGALIARRDAELVGLRDLAGKRIAWVDHDSAAGYVLTRALIAERYPDLAGFLGPQELLGSHRKVVEAVHAKRCDVGATFLNFDLAGHIVHSGWQEFLGERASDIVPVAVTGSIPGDVLAVSHDLPRDTAKAITAALRQAAADPATRELFAKVFNGAEAVAEVRPGEYDALAALARRAGWRP